MRMFQLASPVYQQRHDAIKVSLSTQDTKQLQVAINRPTSAAWHLLKLLARYFLSFVLPWSFGPATTAADCFVFPMGPDCAAYHVVMVVCLQDEDIAYLCTVLHLVTRLVIKDPLMGPEMSKIGFRPLILLLRHQHLQVKVRLAANCVLSQGCYKPGCDQDILA